MYCLIFFSLWFHSVYVFLLTRKSVIQEFILQMRVLPRCISFFPSQMLKPIHRNPMAARSHCFPRLLTASCLLNRYYLASGTRYELPAPATSVSRGDIRVFSYQQFPRGAQGHQDAWLLQGCLSPGLAPVLPAAPTSCQRCILTALPWKSALYNPYASFLLFF